MSGNKFVAGETLSYVDFMFWEILDHMELFDASLFDGLGKICLSAHYSKNNDKAAHLSAKQMCENRAI